MMVNALKKKSRFTLFELLICVFYMWYFLPIVNSYFSSGTYKLLFFGCFAIGTVGVFLYNRAHFSVNKITVAIIAYFLYFLFLFVFNIDDANAHIRVSFTFWGTGLLYFGVLNEEQKLRIGKFLLLIFLITCITSAIGVTLDNSAARTIAHAAADEEMQYQYKQMNIANVYLFQCMIFFIPVLISLPKKLSTKMVAWAVLLLLLAVLVNASFTIALVLFMLALALSIVLNQKGAKRLVAALVAVTALILMVTFGRELLTWISQTIDNPLISERILELRALLYSGYKMGDAGLRFDLYAVSLATFSENLLGVGAHYSYVKFENGIGYHSQLFDDLARYGLGAIAFYGVFLVGYYQQLKKAWFRFELPQVATVTVVIYLLFLVLNLGFRAAEESVVVLFILPVLPQIVESYRSRKEYSKKGQRYENTFRHT